MGASLERIDIAATRMTRLIQDLLDVARLQSGQQLELQLAPTDLVAIVQQVLAEQEEQTEQHELRLVATQPAVSGQWDAIRLERVVRNLVSNAVKYSPNGGAVTVTVDLLPEQGQARLIVEDAGIGIPATDLPHVFDGFRRASNVAGRIGGTGIGLASTRQIVEQHGGTIGIESEEGRGTRVTVSLPLQLEGGS
jgi:signal transduction histidine kinase